MSKSTCPSTIHYWPVVGTVPGFYINPYDGEDDGYRVTYCERCAEIGEEVGLFTRDYRSHE